jgi:hypothetical protein
MKGVGVSLVILNFKSPLEERGSLGDFFKFEFPFRGEVYFFS